MNVQRFNAATSREALAKARMAFGDALRQTLADQPDQFDRIQILRATMNPMIAAASKVLAGLA